MTVSTTVSKKVYSGNGVTTAFATTFQFFDNTDLVVTLISSAGVETVKTLTTHYTVTGGDGATGTVTMITAPASGETLVIERSVPYTQSTDYIANDSFPAEAHEQALDRVTMLAQQAANEALSTPSLPTDYEPGVDTRPTIEMPVADKVLVGNSGATGWEHALLTDLVTVDGIPVSITGLATNDLLRYNGTNWVNIDKVALGNLPTLAANSFLGRGAGSGDAQNLSALEASTALVTAARFGLKAISGWTYSRDAGDTSNDIAIAAGSGADSTGAAWLSGAAMVKRLDAAWAAGTGNGGLDTGAVGNNSYYIWAILKDSDLSVDYLFSLSATAPTMPSGYTYKRLIGWFTRSGGVNVAFTTYELAGGGLEYRWGAYVLDADLSNTLTTSRRTDAVRVPLDFSTEAILHVVGSDNSASFVAIICCPDDPDVAPTSTTAPLPNIIVNAVSEPDEKEIRVRTGATGLVASRASLATVDIYRISTIGFQWSRR